MPASNIKTNTKYLFNLTKLRLTKIESSYKFWILQLHSLSDIQLSFNELFFVCRCSVIAIHPFVNSVYWSVECTLTIVGQWRYST